MSWRNLIWMSIILALAGLTLHLSRRRPPPVRPADAAAEDLAGAVEAYRLIQQNSYEKPSPEEACRGAIEGMAKRVDEFSTYLSPEKADAVSRRLRGTLEETGLRITVEGDRLVVVGPLPDSPAHKAKLYAGVEILAIDGVEAAYLSLAEARGILEAGGREPVRLAVRDAGGKKSLVTLKPGRFDVETVTGIVRDPAGRWINTLDEEAGIYYIRIAEFVRRTPSRLHETYRGLDSPRGLVLDLRDNPGGRLQPAAEIADRFLSKGVIVRTVSRRGREYVHHAHPLGTYPPVSLVVLINGRTASAAELVAGALQIHKRAALVGRDTYGKWYVQTAVDLPEGLGKLYLSTARYFLPRPLPATLPDGAAATGKAPPPTTPAAAEEQDRIHPDVTVRLTARAMERLALLRLRGVVVPAPGRPGTASADGKPDARSEKLKRSILALDGQLAEAVRLLKEGRAPSTRPAGEADTSPARRGRPPGPRVAEP